MNCNDVNKNLIGYIERTIPSALLEEMDDHFKGCLKCRHCFENVKATYTAFDHMPLPQIDRFFITRIEQKLKEMTWHEVSMIPEMIWKLKPFAATVLIVIGISIGIIIGKSLSGSENALNNTNRAELLEAYASDYYLTGTGDEGIKDLITNE
jgi:hypothetical protein